MSILRDYKQNGVPQGNRFFYSTKNEPLVPKKVPLDFDEDGPSINGLALQGTRRVDDLVRITKLLATTPAGVKFALNQTLLRSNIFSGGKFKDKAKQLGQAALTTAKVIGSTLAQVPVSGTGIHFVQGFQGTGKNTYLRQLGVYNDIIDPTTGQPNPDAGNDKTPPHVLARTAPNLSYQPDNTPIGVGGNIPTHESLRNVPFTSEGDGSETLKTYVNSGLANKIVKENDRRNKENEILEIDPEKETAAGTPEEGTEIKKRQGTLRARIGMSEPDRLKGEGGYRGQSDRLNMIDVKDESTFTEEESSVKFGQTTARDLVKFRIHVITPDNVKRLYFRALIDSFSDQIVGQWNNYNYVGRAESFYTYQNFDRQVSVNFKIHAFSAQEMKPLYRKLNYLASSLAPTYRDTFMRGTFHKIEIGDYLSKQPCIIESVNYSWSNDYAFEIAQNRPEGLAEDIGLQELPTTLEVQLQCRLLHNFIPETSEQLHFITSQEATEQNEFLKTSTTK